MTLKNSQHRSVASFDEVIAIAGDARGDDPEGYRSEFVRLVQSCRLIAPNLAAK